MHVDEGGPQNTPLVRIQLGVGTIQNFLKLWYVVKCLVGQHQWPITMSSCCWSCLQRSRPFHVSSDSGQPFLNSRGKNNSMRKAIHKHTEFPRGSVCMLLHLIRSRAGWGRKRICVDARVSTCPSNSRNYLNTNREGKQQHSQIVSMRLCWKLIQNLCPSPTPKSLLVFPVYLVPVPTSHLLAFLCPTPPPQISGFCLCSLHVPHLSHLTLSQPGPYHDLSFPCPAPQTPKLQNLPFSPPPATPHPTW